MYICMNECICMHGGSYVNFNYLGFPLNIQSWLLVYIIAWSAVVLGINSTSNVGSNFHEAKPSEISCITSAINP